MTRALVVLALLGASPTAFALRIGIERSADPISEPVLLAMQLEFPEADVVAIDHDAPAAPDLVATIAVTRTASGFLVRVVERGAPIAVEREIPGEGGDEAAAQAVALLARSLLGVALLYEPERTAASPPLRAIAKAPAARASKALVPRPPPVEPERPRAWTFGAGPALATGLGPAPSTRLGATLEVLYRIGRSPFEVGARALVLVPDDVDRPGAHLSYAGIPIFVRAGYLAEVGDFAFGAGAGLSIERASVSAKLDGENDRTFTDWNAAAALDARARASFSPALALDLAAALTAPATRQDYRWRDEVVLSVGSALSVCLTVQYHY